MDVDLGHGKSGRIGIHEHDDPGVLARNFAALYHLDAALCARLEGLLVRHMEQAIPGFRERVAAGGGPRATGVKPAAPRVCPTAPDSPSASGSASPSDRSAPDTGASPDSDGSVSPRPPGGFNENTQFVEDPEDP